MLCAMLRALLCCVLRHCAGAAAPLDNINLFSIITVLSGLLLLPVSLFMEGWRLTPAGLQAAVSCPPCTQIHTRGTRTHTWHTSCCPPYPPGRWFCRMDGSVTLEGRVCDGGSRRAQGREWLCQAGSRMLCGSGAGKARKQGEERCRQAACPAEVMWCVAAWLAAAQAQTTASQGTCMCAVPC